LSEGQQKLRYSVAALAITGHRALFSIIGGVL